jgi:hypothetical protein
MARIGSNASSCAMWGHGVFSRRLRGVKAVDDGSTANTDEDEIRTLAGPSSAVQ